MFVTLVGVHERYCELVGEDAEEGFVPALEGAGRGLSNAITPYEATGIVARLQTIPGVNNRVQQPLPPG